MSLPTQHDAQAVADNLRALRERAFVYCVQQMEEAQINARLTLAKMQALTEAAGLGESADFAEAHADLHKQADFYGRLFRVFAVKGIVLSGRLPEDREAEAFERCADDDGLIAFLLEMRHVPLGFIDPPAAAPTRN